ncbi:MAG: GAF domain-containing protein [Chitinophagales bacterium]
MSASSEMPYFIKPSLQLTETQKMAAYTQAKLEIDAILANEINIILKMVTINCVLKTYLPYYYWVGFYGVNEKQKNKLSVGPYQGTLGCLHIAFGKGVCGGVAASQKTQIVSDVHALVEGEAHITCDPNSQSEIVVPVFDKLGKLIAVFDVDSSVPNSFDETDKNFLEKILHTHFVEKNLNSSYFC